MYYLEYKMKDKNNNSKTLLNIFIFLYFIIYLSVLTDITSKNSFLQYNWDISTNKIVLYEGMSSIDSLSLQNLFYFNIFLVLLASIIFILTDYKKILPYFFLIFLTLYLLNPYLVTYVLLWPIVLLSYLHIEITFTTKTIFFLINILIMIILYKGLIVKNLKNINI